MAKASLELQLAAQRTARRIGLDVRPYRPAATRRHRLMTDRRIDCVVDVGANVGRYGTELREWGYAERIISFEPLPDVFEILAARAASDPLWECANLALGADEGQERMYRSASSDSSSLLAMLDRHLDAAPLTGTIGELVVQTATLDGALSQRDTGEDVMIKLDVQGFEDRVLAGAADTLARTSVVECELSVLPLYEGQRSLTEMLLLLNEHGFSLVDLEPGFHNNATGEVLSFDGLLVRR